MKGKGEGLGLSPPPTEIPGYVTVRNLYFRVYFHQYAARTLYFRAPPCPLTFEIGGARAPVGYMVPAPMVSSNYVLVHNGNGTELRQRYNGTSQVHNGTAEQNGETVTAERQQKAAKPGVNQPVTPTLLTDGSMGSAC